MRRSKRKRASAEPRLERQSLWSWGALDISPRAEALARLWEAFGSGLARGTRGHPSHPPGTNGRLASGRNGRVDGGIYDSADATGLGRWLDRVDVNSPIAPSELLILHEMLLHFGRDLPAALHWRLWRTTLSADLQFSAADARNELPDALCDEQLLVRGELPWQAGLLFAGIKGAARWRENGRRTLRRELLNRTDTDGTPAADVLPRLAPWMASLVRSATWADALRADLWDDEATGRFRALARTAVSLCRPDGRLPLGSAGCDRAAPLLASATRLAGWRENSLPVRLLQAIERPPATASRTERLKTALSAARKQPPSHRPAFQSDWASLASLRSDWSPAADMLIVDHHRETPRIELSALGVPLLSGAWEIAASLDGKPLQFADEWSCTCWFSDEDADYLELQSTPARGVTVDRQLLLSRAGRFAVLADCLSGPRTATIEYASRLPMVERVGIRADVPTRECVLKARGVSARVFPLGLACERVMSTPGALAAVEDRLELKQTAIGGLYAPLVLDWHPRRQRQYADWRTLTVTEDGRRLKSDSAAGHRLRIGDQHLLIYRSLARGETARAVLGHHTAHETVIGRFGKTGEVTPILLVE